MSTDKTEQALPPLPEPFMELFREFSPHVYAAWAKQMQDYARAALTAAPPAQQQSEPLKGWKLNHVQFVRGSGTAEIGYLDPEDDRFSPIVTVDTGPYYQPDAAVPLAQAILDALATTPPSLQEPQEALMWVELRKDGSIRSRSDSAPSQESREIAAIEGCRWVPLYASTREAVEPQEAGDNV